jgi:hypothetical protein
MACLLIALVKLLGGWLHCLDPGAGNSWCLLFQLVSVYGAMVLQLVSVFHGLVVVHHPLQWQLVSVYSGCVRKLGSFLTHVQLVLAKIFQSSHPRASWCRWILGMLIHGLICSLSLRFTHNSAPL